MADVPVSFAYRIHGIRQISVNIVVKLNESIHFSGISPVDNIDVHAQIQKILYEAAIRLQVHHVLAVDQCITDQKRNWADILAGLLVMIDCHLVFFKDGRLLGCLAVNFTRREGCSGQEPFFR